LAEDKAASPNRRTQAPAAVIAAHRAGAFKTTSRGVMAAGGFAAGAGMSLNAPASLAISAALADENERSLTPETAADLAAGISAAMGQGGAAAVVEEQLKRNESRKSSGFFSSLFGKSKKGASGGGGDREDQSSPPPGKEFPKRGSEGSEDLPKRGSLEKRGSKELSPAEMPETRRKSFFGLGRSNSGSSKRGADSAAAEPAADPSDPDWAVWSAHDQDRSGTVSTEELGGLFWSAGLELSAAQLAALLASADHDGSGRLSFKEFKALLLRCRADGVANVVSGAAEDADWVAYARFDRDGGAGSVSPTDFAALFDAAGVKLDAAQTGVIAASCSEADGGGRRLAFANFKALLAKCRAEGVATVVASMSSSPTPAAAAPEAKRDWVRSKLDAESAVVAGAGAAGARGSAGLEPACQTPPPAPAAGVAGVAAAGAAAAEGAPQQLPLKRKVRKGKPAAANGVSPTGTSPSSATRSLSSVSPPPLVEGSNGGVGGARSAPVPLKPKTKTKAPLPSSTGATTPTGGSGAAGGGQKLVRQGSGSGKIPIRADSPTTADAVPKRRKKPKDKAGGVTRERTI